MDNRLVNNEILIILSMLDRIIVDDLLQESRLDLFEEKKRWHNLWRKKTKESYGLEEDLLGWEQLKERVVEWLKDDRAYAGRTVILDMCCSFKPYSDLPCGKGKAPSSVVKEQGRVQASPEAREISLEKICRLLGIEDKWQELFPSQLV